MLDINPQNIQKLSQLLINAEDIAIVSHMRPDGDAVGSCMAMHHFIKMTGRRSHVILPHTPPASLDFLTSGDLGGRLVTHETEPTEAEALINSADLIICLDMNAFHRADKLEGPLTSSKAPKVLIDHHLNPDRENFDLVFSETEISSASELVYHILMKFPQIGHDASRLPAEAAEALMTGMTTDTNNFANSVFPSTLQMASALLAAGTDRDKILALLFNRFNENRLRLMGHMMKDLMHITDDGVAYIVLDRKTQIHYNTGEGDTEGFVNMPLTIEKVRMSILAKEDIGKVRISIRSKKGTSANMCARLHFNGGGHENAAGGKLAIPEDITSIEQASQYIEHHTHTFFNNEIDR